MALALLAGSMLGFTFGKVTEQPPAPVPVVVDIGDPATLLRIPPETRAPEPAKQVGGQDGQPFISAVRR